MKITRENYEAYFIDLLDGSLNEEMVDILLDFMRENPDLAEEIRDLDNVKLEPTMDLPAFNHKPLLKTDLDSPEIFDETCIRAIEDDLSEKESAAFIAYLSKNEAAKKEFALFQATVSEPDPFVVYENKNQLKRSRKISPVWWAAAAMLAVALTFWFTVPDSNHVNQLPKPEIAQLQVEKPANRVHLTTTEIVPVEEVQIASVAEEEKTTPPVREVHEPMPLLALVDVEIQSDALMVAQMETEIVPVLPPAMNQKYYPTIPELLAQEAQKIDPRRELGKLGRFVLDKIRNITDDKLDYTTLNNGQLRKIEYNSRLLAFSIPVNSSEPK